MDLSRPTRPRLWFALLGGMSAYALHLVVSFWIVPGLCPVRPGVVPWLVAATTVAAGAVALAATVVGLRARTRLAQAQPAPTVPRPPPGHGPPAWDVSPDWSAARFLANAGVLLSGLGLAVVLAAGLPLLLVHPCA